MSTDDSLHVVIESTIIIESEIRAILDLLFINPKALDEAELSYHQQLCLVFATGLDLKLKRPLQSLGNIRNSYAHKLMPEIDKNTINGFMKTLSDRERKIVRERYDEIRARPPKEGQGSYPPFSDLEPAMKFVLCIIVLRAALITSKRRLLEEVSSK